MATVELVNARRIDGTSRACFKAALPSVDEGTWTRARGWALWKALIELPRSGLNDPARTRGRFGWRWDAAAVIDHVVHDAHPAT